MTEIEVDNHRAPKYNFKKANWELYKALVDDNLARLNLNSDINALNSDIVQALIQAADKSIPKLSRKGKTKYKPLPYWSEKCKDIIKRRNKARNKFNKLRSQDSLLNYRRLKGIAQPTVKNAASTYWQNCSSITNSRKLGSVWKRVRSMRGVGTGFKVGSSSKNNQNFTNAKDRANLLAEKFANFSSDSNYSREFINSKEELNKEITLGLNNLNNSNNDNVELNTRISSEELYEAIKLAKTKSSPGPDLIPYELLKQLTQNSLDFLLKFFNRIFQIQNFLTSGGRLPSYPCASQTNLFGPYLVSADLSN